MELRTFQFEGTHYRVRAAQFLPRPAQSPRIPLWVAGGWPNKATFRRAARWDGVFPQDTRLYFGEKMAPQELQRLLDYMAHYREPGSAFEVALSGITPGEDAERDQALVASYAAVGLTWWLEDFLPHRWGGNWSEWPLEQRRRRVRQGPGRCTSRLATKDHAFLAFRHTTHTLPFK